MTHNEAIDKLLHENGTPLSEEEKREIHFVNDFMINEKITDGKKLFDAIKEKYGKSMSLAEFSNLISLDHEPK